MKRTTARSGATILTRAVAVAAAAVTGTVMAVSLAAAGPAQATDISSPLAGMTGMGGMDMSTTAAPGPGAYGSSATAVHAELHDIPIGPLTVANWPSGPTHAVLTGSQHLLELGLLETNASGSYEDGWDSADASVARVKGSVASLLSIDLGLITSQCRADSTGVSGSSHLAGGTIKILGKGALTIPENPAPNTHLSIPGLLDVTLNKQVRNANGTLTVTAIDIEGTKTLQTLLLTMHPLFLKVSQSTCDAVTPPYDPPMVAGVGAIGSGVALAILGAGTGVMYVRRRRATASLGA